MPRPLSPRWNAAVVSGYLGCMASGGGFVAIAVFYPGVWDISPIWELCVVFILMSVCTVAFAFIGWRFAGRKRPVGLCLRCGYNLTGNLTGVCPECGSPIHQARTRHL